MACSALRVRALGPSDSTEPSRMWITRCAYSAISGSWVTRTMVLPSAWSVIEESHDFDAGLGIEVAGGLVGQDDGGAVDQGAGDGHALALAAGELIGLVIHALAQADVGQRFLGAVDALGGGGAVVDQRQLHVVQRGGAGQQIEGLKDEADLLVADAGQFVVVELADQLAVEPVRPLDGRSPGSRSGSSAWICRSRTGP